MDPVPPAQLTHVGLHVADIDAMVAFYTGLVGLVVTDQGELNGRRLAFLSRRADEHHQLVLVTGRHVPEGTRLLSQVSFRTDDLHALRWFRARALELGACAMEDRDHGNSWSIYFLDPEGNRVEVYAPTPWAVHQPWREPLDLDQPDAVIVATTRERLERGGPLRAATDWQAELAARLGATARPAGTTTDHRSIWTELRDVAFTQRWLDADGVSTRIVEAGDPTAPAIVMLHGTGGHWETFARNLGPLSATHRCVAIDMVGNGFSDKPEVDYEIPVYVHNVRAVMRALGIERATLVGTSLGSWVAARLALDHPGEVEALVLCSTTGLYATPSNMARIRNVRTQAVDDPSWTSIKAMFDHLLAHEEDRLPDLVALRQAIYRRADTKAAMPHVLVLQEPDRRERNLLTEDQWRAITPPALVVASGRDEYESTSRRVARLMPRAELLEMPDVGHWPHFEDAPTFNAAVLRFVG